ncbi:MAG: MGMT family protein [Candidatus Moranbacteria bacterium]|jgi:methylated-DNA-[protein]-cysteine S-methyltransferase|nr:MGMT family protein [Candidatus Moranbacteria bacterium]MBP9801793.1 MGMT family protein [Candidatus Moranbacteria bacterium]
MRTPQNFFSEAVHAVVMSIPRGTTLSYAGVAEKAGFSGAARAVGSLMKKNYSLEIPCHRVICSDGRVGAYNRGGEKEKAFRLKQEGILIQSRMVTGRLVWMVVLT